jgi:hypothetical protein
VRKPEGSFVRVGELLVLPDRLSMLDEGDMDQVPYAEVARRGAGPTRSWAVELGLGVHAGVVTGAGLTPAVGAALLRERGPWAFAVGFELASVDFAAQQLSATQRELWGRADARLRWPVAWTLPYLGISLGVGWVHQAFTRPEEGVIRDVFHVSVPNRDGLAGRLVLTAGLELPLSGRVCVRLEAGGGVTGVHGERGWSVLPAALAGISGGSRF